MYVCIYVCNMYVNIYVYITVCVTLKDNMWCATQKVAIIPNIGVRNRCTTVSRFGNHSKAVQCSVARRRAVGDTTAWIASHQAMGTIMCKRGQDKKNPDARALRERAEMPVQALEVAQGPEGPEPRLDVV